MSSSVSDSVLRSNPLSSGVRVLWPGKFLVQVQVTYFRSFTKVFLADWNAGWGVTFNSIPRNMINKLSIFAFSGLCCSKLFPLPSWPQCLSKVVSSARGQMLLSSTTFISTPGSAFYSIVGAAGNVYSGDQYICLCGPFRSGFVRLFKSPISLPHLWRRGQEQRPGSVFC